jgi:hypothetical protein
MNEYRIIALREFLLYNFGEEWQNKLATWTMNMVKAVYIHLLLFGLILAGCSNSTSPGSEKSTISKTVKKQLLEKASATVGWQPYGSRYAIIVMSDGRNSDEYFWPVTKSMYSYLRTMGFDKEDIRFLAPSKYATNHPDIVSDEAVETKIEEAYKWAKSICTPKDLLYVFWISHGTSSDFTTAGNSVRHSTLSAWMQGITAKQIIGVYQPCFSGTVVDDISRENIITTTSTNPTASNNWPWAENIAFAVAGPPYCDQWMNPNHELEPAKYSADHDGDGQVSMTEAYIWVAKHRYTEGSMFDDNGDGVGGQWTKDTFDPNDPNKDGYNGNHYSLRGWKPIRNTAVKSDSGKL